MKRIFALALAILTLLSLPALAENYYVDAQNGSDSNSGTSPETAWKTLRNVKRHEFQPGDSIYLHAGQVWRDHFRCTSSGEPGKPITYGVYGKGPKPALWGMKCHDPELKGVPLSIRPQARPSHSTPGARPPRGTGWRTACSSTPSGPAAPRGCRAPVCGRP